MPGTVFSTLASIRITEGFKRIPRLIESESPEGRESMGIGIYFLKFLRILGLVGFHRYHVSGILK